MENMIKDESVMKICRSCCSCVCACMLLAVEYNLCGKLNVGVRNIAPYLHAVILFDLFSSFYVLFVAFLAHSSHSFMAEKWDTWLKLFALSKVSSSPFCPLFLPQVCHWLGNLIRCQSKCECVCSSVCVCARVTWKKRSFLFQITIEIDIADLTSETTRNEMDISFTIHTKIPIKAFSRVTSFQHYSRSRYNEFIPFNFLEFICIVHIL